MIRGSGFLVFCVLTAACTQEDDRQPSQSQPTDEIARFAELQLENTLPTSFGYLSGARELADGTVLVADPLAPALLRLHPESGVVDTLGRIGGGPGEYRQPDHVFALPGDSTLMVDLGRLRLVAVSPDGLFGSGHPMSFSTRDGDLHTFIPRFIDARGRLYAEAPRNPEGPPDSIAVVRYGRNPAALDTVAFLWLPEYRRGGWLMLAGRGDWAVGPDGSVAVIRAHGYAIDWYRPTGEFVAGSPNEFDSHAIGSVDKEVFMEEMASGALSVTSLVSESGTESRSYSRGVSDATGRPSADDFQWAEKFPPFKNGGSLVSPDGNLWVERMLPHDLPPRMEVFNRAGERLGYVPLPVGRRMVAFSGVAGSLAVYLVRTDEVGLKWLERYRIAFSES
jgi:hypothetical protein